ncbi:MAG: mitofilin family membrane protein, partial [Alphaproteobacteria bacterium]
GADGNEQPASAPPPAAPSAARHEGHAVLWTSLVAFLIVAFGAGAAMFYWQGIVRATIEQKSEEIALNNQKLEASFAKDLSTLEHRIATLEQRVDEVPDLSAIKDTEAATAVLGEKTEGLIVRMGALEGKLSALEQRTGPAEIATAEEAKRAAAKLAEEMTALQQRLAAIEEADRPIRSVAAAERRQALVLAVGQLREAISSGNPFRQELDGVMALGAEDEEVMRAVRPLESSASQGVSTLSELRALFPKVADAVVHADTSQTGGRWIDTAIARAAAVVTVRKVGPDVQGTTPEAIVARAEAKLAAGDLRSAVGELDALQGPAAAAAQDWVTGARAKLSAEDALAAVHQHVIGEIAQGGGPDK